MSWHEISWVSDFVRVFFVINIMIFIILIIKLLRKSEKPLMRHNIFILLYICTTIIIDLITVANIILMYERNKNIPIIERVEIRWDGITFLAIQVSFWIFPLINIILHYFLKRKKNYSSPQTNLNKK